jgi:hypothetical protein
MRKMMLFPVLIAVAMMLFTACSRKEVNVTSATPPLVEKQVVIERTQPPPAPIARVEVPGPPPAAGYVWVPGYWDWNGHDYVWISGRYQASRPDSVWVAGHWQGSDSGWQWVPGYWKCSVC